jgi:hypothetical protein
MLVIEEIKYLKPGLWLGNNSINCYMLQHWLKIKDQSPVLYLSTYHIIVCSQGEPPSNKECRMIQRQLLLPEDGIVPMQPITFIIHNDFTRHYFTMAMHHDRLHVTTYSWNKDIDKCHYTPEPAEWAGPHIWRNICTLFNWAIPAQQPTWWAIDENISSDIFYLKSDWPVRIGLIVIH